MNLTIHSLPYASDLIQNYHALSDLPGFALLESGDQQQGRYDIVTACPYNQFKVMRDTSDPKQAFEALQRMLPRVSSRYDFPFQGGAIGYLAYDLGAILAGIDSKPYALLDDMPLIDMHFYDWAVIVDHHRKHVNLVAAHQHAATSSILREVLARWQSASVTRPSFTLRQAFAPLISKEEYHAAFQQIHKDITRGRAYQVNYTQPFVGYYSGDAWEIYKRIRQHNPVPFAAFLRHAGADILSFSPERFLRMQHNQLLTSPIKGTARRSASLHVDAQLRAELMQCAKNRAENVMIVDLMRNDLGRIAKPGSVNVTALCEVQSFHAVHHLVSHIEAICHEHITPIEAFAACFPGGSITGAPKREAMRIISEHERYARGVYCGSIGYFSSHGDFDSNIAIRTITAKNETLYMAAGGGIVMDSCFEDEYRECYTKIAAIVRALLPQRSS